MAHILSQAAAVKGRKPGTAPLVGETFDMVTPDFKYIGELNSLDPFQITCHAEGASWELFGGFDAFRSKMKPCTEAGSTTLDIKNVFDYKFKKYDDHITGMRP
jgi:hypothetical protein